MSNRCRGGRDIYLSIYIYLRLGGEVHHPPGPNRPRTSRYIYILYTSSHMYLHNHLVSRGSSNWQRTVDRSIRRSTVCLSTSAGPARASSATASCHPAGRSIPRGPGAVRQLVNPASPSRTRTPSSRPNSPLANWPASPGCPSRGLRPARSHARGPRRDRRATGPHHPPRSPAGMSHQSPPTAQVAKRARRRATGPMGQAVFASTRTLRPHLGCEKLCMSKVAFFVLLGTRYVWGGPCAVDSPVQSGPPSGARGVKKLDLVVVRPPQALPTGQPHPAPTGESRSPLHVNRGFTLTRQLVSPADPLHVNRAHPPRQLVSPAGRLNWSAPCAPCRPSGPPPPQGPPANWRVPRVQVSRPVPHRPPAQGKGHRTQLASP